MPKEKFQDVTEREEVAQAIYRLKIEVRMLTQPFLRKPRARAYARARLRELKSELTGILQEIQQALCR